MNSSLKCKTKEDLKDFLLDMLKKGSFENLTFFMQRRVIWREDDQYWFFVVYDNDCIGMFNERDYLFDNFLKSLGLDNSDMLEIYYRVQCIDIDSLTGTIQYYLG